eukprot:122356-Chlamydomonas_euryale.AAC.5
MQDMCSAALRRDCKVEKIFFLGGRRGLLGAGVIARWEIVTSQRSQTPPWRRRGHAPAPLCARTMLRRSRAVHRQCKDLPSLTWQPGRMPGCLTGMHQSGQPGKHSRRALVRAARTLGGAADVHQSGQPGPGSQGARKRSKRASVRAVRTLGVAADVQQSGQPGR